MKVTPVDLISRNLFSKVPNHATWKENLSLKEVAFQIRNKSKLHIFFWVQR